MKHALWVAAMASLSCTFIPPHQDAGTRVVIEKPKGGQDAGGGGKDGGTPDSGTRLGWPGSGTNGDRGTDVLLLFRIDRGSGVLAPRYSQIANDIEGALKAQDFQVNVVAAGDLYRGTLFWHESFGLPLADAITAAAQSAPLEQPTGCTTAGLLDHAPVIYNWSLVGPNGQDLNDYPFASPPSVILVVLVDSAPRPLALDACGNGREPLADYFSSTDPEPWLSFSDGHRPRLQVGLVTVATAEGVSDETFRANCRAMPGFPSGVLDQLAPSPISYFDPLVDDLQATVPAERFDLCAAIAGQWNSALKVDFGAWAKQLQGQ